MPFVICKTNVPIFWEQGVEFKARLGRTIAHVFGKSEH